MKSHHPGSAGQYLPNWHVCVNVHVADLSRQVGLRRSGN